MFNQQKLMNLLACLFFGIQFATGFQAEDHRWCNFLNDTAAKCDVDLKRLCPTYCKDYPGYNEEDYLPRGFQCEDNKDKKAYNPCSPGYFCADEEFCRFGRDCCKLYPKDAVPTKTYKVDYLPNERTCESNSYDNKYNPCDKGYYCADDEFCNFSGLDCCKPYPEEALPSEETKVDHLPNERKCKNDRYNSEYNPCDKGYYCADDKFCGFSGLDCCKPYPEEAVPSEENKVDYLPNQRECENDWRDSSYNPCDIGYHCTDNKLCNFSGLDCCKAFPLPNDN